MKNNLLKRKVWDKKYRENHKKENYLRTKEWKEKNKEKHLEWVRNYYRKYRKRDYVKKREAKYDKKRKPADKGKNREKLLNLKLEFGGKCIDCGYKDEIRILQFHHLRDKRFELSLYSKPIKLMREEAKKCVLLCPNCHSLKHLQKRV